MCLKLKWKYSVIVWKRHGFWGSQFIFSLNQLIHLHKSPKRKLLKSAFLVSGICSGSEQRPRGRSDYVGAKVIRRLMSNPPKILVPVVLIKPCPILWNIISKNTVLKPRDIQRERGKSCVTLVWPEVKCSLPAPITMCTKEARSVVNKSQIDPPSVLCHGFLRS